jgi:hypothetical protein
MYPFQCQKLWCEAVNMKGVVLMESASYNRKTQQVNTRQDIGSILVHILHQEVC